MKDFLIQNGAFIFWAAVALLALIIEAMTAELVSCWFAPSALVAMIISPFVRSIWIQITVFLALSILLLAIGRTLLKKKLDFRKANLNADSLIGKTGVIQEAVNNLLETGSVKIAGLTWTARSANGEEIPAGTAVVIREIQGVKLICEPTAEKPAVKTRVKQSGGRSDLNADSLIGKTGVVQEPINNLAETGSVRIAGLVWSARSTGGEEIPEGTVVLIRNIQGVKLICEPKKNG